MSKILHYRHKADSLPFGIEKFHALGDLMDEFATFNTDSAYNVLLLRERMARELNDTALILNTVMNRANLLNAVASYSEALRLMDDVRPEKLPSYLHPFYYHIKRTVYGRLADFSTFPEEKKKYERLTAMYRDSLLSINPPESMSYTITYADKLNSEGKPQEAIRVVEDYIKKNNLSDHEQAIFSWTLADSYRYLGDSEARKEQLMISAISDLKSGIREYASLRELAAMLQEEGDTERAYKYMTVAIDDAAKAHARQRIVELNALYPMVNEIYIEKIQSQKRALGWTIAIMSVLFAAVVLLLFYTRNQHKKVVEAKKNVQEAYDKLDRTNSELMESNKNLEKANKDIAEISQMKEVYIGRYMDQCLEYIERLESFRKSLAKMLAMGKTEELKKNLTSSSAMNDDLKNFYDQFDKTFLRLFPTFVEDFNSLLLPDEAIIPKKEGTLNTELRIFALIRLGITDSESIAKFLRYSLTTIYNYRTRVRNKAKGDRNLLEQEVAKIGQKI